MTAVTYSVMSSWRVIVLRACTVGGLPLESCKQRPAIEFADAIVQSDLLAALDGLGKQARRHSDDGDCGGAWIATQYRCQLEAIHFRHIDVGDDHVEGLIAIPGRRQCALARPGRGNLVSGGLEQRREHVSEERGIIDEQRPSHDAIPPG